MSDADIVEAKNTEPNSERWTQTGAGDVLIVDDNPQNLIAIEAALGDLAGRLVKAHSGREALRHLLAEDFALILLDVQMPSMDGFETAQLIRRRTRTQHVPIIFLTAYDTNERDVLDAYELGAVDFLFKPIVPAILRAKASVFVALQRRTAEVSRQAALLRQHERREHERELAEQRRRWEEEALRQRMEEHQRNNEELARRAEELARTVAERERAERELTRINCELEQADRRKDEFLAMLAHELRNPLAPLVTGLELIRNQASPDPLIRRVRDSMDRQVRQLCRLVDDLLDVSRITAGKITLRSEWIDFAEVVRQAVASCRALIDERGQTLTLEMPREPLGVYGDAARLTQVTCNLIHNASRYTDPGGHLEVSCGADEDQAVLRVSDSGRGISKEILDRIFDMFVQGSPGEGLGLGLTLVERLVELHGGDVSAESPGEGMGSTFTVRIPLGAGRVAAGGHNGVERLNGIEMTPLRIVLIEDNVDIRDMLHEFLEMLGHSVQVAGDGPAGLELVLKVHPDVALVDIGLPKLDGYGVAERIRAALPGGTTRLVAMTGYGQPADQKRAEGAGFDNYLVKPASLEELMRALRGD